MLSPATEQFTQKAIAAYDEIVAGGGWPTVPHVDELRVGNRHPSVVDLRQRLSLSGDLDPNAVGAANDIYDSTSKLRYGAFRRATASPSMACCAPRRSRRSMCRRRHGAISSRSNRAAEDSDHQSRAARCGGQNSGRARRGDRE